MNRHNRTHLTIAFTLLAISCGHSVIAQDANPNRATSGNDDPTRGIKGENLRGVNSGLPANPINQTPQSEANPNRATSGNTDPARGVKGQNLMPVQSGLPPNPINQTPGRALNPNRATSGNTDPAHGVKGENLMDVYPDGAVYPSLYGSVGASGFPRTAKMMNQVSERERIHQIYLQIQGYGAFDDRDVQRKLNLTEDQRQIFRQLDQDWTKRLANSNSQYIQNGQSANDSFDEYERDFQTNVTSTLTAEQNQQWQTLIGRPFGLGPELYARSAPIKTTTAKPPLK